MRISDWSSDMCSSDLAAVGEAVANHDGVSDPASAANIVKTAIDAWSRVDILVNNAGILRDKTFAKMELADFDTVVDVHFLGSAYVTKAAWPVMQQQNYGRIVMTSSNSGLYGNFGQSNYAGAKMAVVGLMTSLKQDRSEARRVGKECVSTCRSRWSP